MTYGLRETFLLAGTCHMCCLYQNQEKTQQTLQITVLLLLPAAFARSWNAWSTTDSCVTCKETKLSHLHSLVSAKVEVPQTSLYVWSLLSEMLLFRSGTAIFFDLEKAHDKWKFGILKDLHDAGLRGRLPLFIAGFLWDRKFQVRVGRCYSKLCEQEMGIPQGSILYVTLFCRKINSIVKALCPGVECSLYVDDFLICYRSKHIHIIERHLQRCLNKLQDWADSNGYKFSTSKTVCIHFCWLLYSDPDRQLFLNGNPVPVVE